MRQVRMAITMALALAGMVEAVDCTGANCDCGERLVANWTMTRHLSCPTGHGLRLAGGVTLTCGPFTITGGTGLNTCGLRYEGANAKAIGCDVRGFYDAVCLYSSGGVYQGDSANSPAWARNAVHYGVRITGDGNALVWTYVTGNKDEGIHIGTGADGQYIAENASWGNTREQLYILPSTGHDILGNYLQGGTNSLYCKGCKDGWFQDNGFVGSSATLIEDARDNVFYRGYTDGPRVLLRKANNKTPTNNYFSTMTFERAGANCVEFDGASGNVIEYSAFWCTTPDARCDHGGTNSIGRSTTAVSTAGDGTCDIQLY